MLGKMGEMMRREEGEKRETRRRGFDSPSFQSCPHDRELSLIHVSSDALVYEEDSSLLVHLSLDEAVVHSLDEEVFEFSNGVEGERVEELGVRKGLRGSGEEEKRRSSASMEGRAGDGGRPRVEKSRRKGAGKVGGGRKEMKHSLDWTLPERRG